MTSVTELPTLQRLPAITLAIPLGLVGLAEVWTIASHSLGINDLVSSGLWLVSAASWVAVVVAHAVRGRRAAQSLRDQLRHPIQGPLFALAPLSLMLLAGHLSHSNLALGRGIAVVAIAAGLILAAWLLSRWVQGLVEISSVHPGYLLPPVATNLVGSVVAGQAELPGLAVATFVAGLGFWLVVGSAVLVRLLSGPALPAPLVPSLAIFAAPPSVAALAWFGIDPTRASAINGVLALIAAIFVALQLFLLPRYRALDFSLGFWSFTFPAAYVSVLALAWLDVLRPAGWQATTVFIVLAVSALVVWVALRSVMLMRAVRATPVGSAAVPQRQ